MTLPTLRTDRLVLEPVGPHHLPLLVALNSDAAVMEFILGRAATSEETEQEWHERLTLRTDAEQGLGYWIGFDSGELVGWWGASYHRKRPEVAVLGWRVRRERWRQGFGVEGGTAVRDQAFTAPGIQLVAAATMAVNTGSRRVMERLGMSYARTLVTKRHDPLPGSEQGEVVYELTRADWTRLGAASRGT